MYSYRRGNKTVCVCVTGGATRSKVKKHIGTISLFFDFNRSSIKRLKSKTAVRTRHRRHTRVTRGRGRNVCVLFLFFMKNNDFGHRVARWCAFFPISRPRLPLRSFRAAQFPIAPLHQSTVLNGKTPIFFQSLFFFAFKSFSVASSIKSCVRIIFYYTRYSSTRVGDRGRIGQRARK